MAIFSSTGLIHFRSRFKPLFRDRMARVQHSQWVPLHKRRLQAHSGFPAHRIGLARIFKSLLHIPDRLLFVILARWYLDTNRLRAPHALFKGPCEWTTDLFCNPWRQGNLDFWVWGCSRKTTHAESSIFVPCFLFEISFFFILGLNASPHWAQLMYITTVKPRYNGSWETYQVFFTSRVHCLTSR
jgi:hypothetical protein